MSLSSNKISNSFILIIANVESCDMTY